jgi:nucleotide-binding universal stress UspA family protein
MSYARPRISKIVVPLDGSEAAMEAADYALLMAKQGNAELIAIHAVRTQDVKFQLTNMLIEDIETPTTADSVLQTIKDNAQKWTHASFISFITSPSRKAIKEIPDNTLVPVGSIITNQTQVDSLPSAIGSPSQNLNQGDL